MDEEKRRQEHSRSNKEADKESCIDEIKQDMTNNLFPQIEMDKLH